MTLTWILILAMQALGTCLRIDMKLSHIAEGFLSHKLKEALPHSYFNRPMVHSNLPALSRGFDQGNRVGGYTFLPSGIPHKPRHRRFLGLSNRSAIVL